MNDIYSMDFSQLLPTALSHDPKMVTLAKAIAGQLLEVSGHINDVLIYSNFDQLPEALVDILAYDMHVDWYDYSYPLSVKRDLVKNSVRVHKRMGTKFAVETALGGLWPDSEVEEWFEYGGTPHHFRVVCDVTENRITASYGQIINTVQMYKRLSSHLEDIVYQTRVVCTIQTHTDFWLYHTPQTNTLAAGTHPRRNMVGGVGSAAVIVGTEAAGFIFTSPLAGTIPQRNVLFQGQEAQITAETALETMKYTNIPAGQVEAGTAPRRATQGGVSPVAVSVEAAAEGSTYAVPVSGTVPDRAIRSTMVTGGVTSQAEGTAFHYTVKRCGSSRKL